MTGAAGLVGSYLRKELRGVYPELRLSDIVEVRDLAAGESFVRAELGDMAAVEAACEGIDGIIHLGGVPVEKPWEMIHAANISGCYNLFEAARRKKVKRVIFASSNHAVGFYRRNRRIGTEAKVRPDSRYGVSKAFGEALGALYADKFGLRVMAIRIGNMTETPADLRRLSIWVSPRDLAQLVRIGLEHPDLQYEVVYGVSDNARGWWDNEAAFRLGYRPQDRSEDHAAAALAAEAKLPPDPLGDLFEGGTFCSDEFDGEERGRGG
ncbi:MAG: NAD(P)-dependent oxidoreductase [Rhodospirillaceae bacterium]|nr:NAD(P)-dependent oxidoreductase [Rhodospirillaceae bacterium]